jgi:dipeptidyl aminopeptidase/acylaminoacyl peptidase
MRLFIFDSKNNKLIPISNDNEYVTSFSLDINQNRVVYTAKPLSDTPIIYDNIYLYDIESKEKKTLYDKLDLSIYYLDFMNDALIAVINDHKDYGLNKNPQFYQIDFTGKITLVHEYDYSIGSSVGSDSRYGSNEQIKMYNNQLYFITTIRNDAHLYRLNTDYQIEKLIELNGSIDGFEINDDKIYINALLNQELSEIYEYDTNTKQLTRITNLNDNYQKNRYIAVPEIINFQSVENDIDGWILKPKNYDENKIYPAILNIHGGPKTVFGEVFFHEMQYWASKGFFVLFSNPTGGDGRGNKFADIRGRYGSVDYQDIMHFTDEVLKKYSQIDIDRIAVTGGSYGGFMTNWIIGHTNRFKVAATQRCISNWMSFYGTTDIGPYFSRDQMAVNDPILEYDKIWNLSPLKYARHINTPLLLIHSDMDYRCWTPESMQLFSAVKENGIAAKMVLFHGENHDLSRSGKPKARIKRLKEITRWIEKYLK